MALESPIIKLRSDWLTLLQGFGVPSTAAQVVFEDLCAAYTSPNRYYHNLQHLQQVLQTVEQLQTYARNLALVKLAVWFHDVVYDAQASNNEEQSVVYAQDCLYSLGVETSAIASISRLILLTKHHQLEPNDGDGQVLLDADLAILGSSPLSYQRYAHAIRQEYAWVSEADYRVGRQQVLERFLQRDRIYATPLMMTLAETAARQNLHAEIASLKNPTVYTDLG